MGTVLITGANRGLGLEFVRQYSDEEWRVIAVCRSETDIGALRGLQAERRIDIEIVDVADFTAVDALAKKYAGEPIDVLINNAGIFGPKALADSDLRQSFGHMDYDIWENILRINTLAPYKLVEAFYENLRSGTEKKVVNLSSTVASISQQEGGLYAYRSSKTALNSVTVALAKDLAESGIAVAALCPGWVNTRMGGEAAPLGPTDSVAGMRKLIEAMNLDNTGQFTRYNGESIPW
ncbi:MAG: SDR family oxidoreductase [Pseudomonadota bacterium]